MREMRGSVAGRDVGPGLGDRIVDLLDFPLVDIDDVGKEVGDVALGVL